MAPGWTATLYRYSPPSWVRAPTFFFLLFSLPFTPTEVLCIAMSAFQIFLLPSVSRITNACSCFRGKAHIQGSIGPSRGGRRRRGLCGHHGGKICQLIKLVKRVRIPAPSFLFPFITVTILFSGLIPSSTSYSLQLEYLTFLSYE